MSPPADPRRRRSWSATRTRTNPTQWLQILVTIAFAAALAMLLVVGMQRADELQAAATTLQLASELAARPQNIRTELTLVQRELETTAYLGDALRTVEALRATSDQSFLSIQSKLRAAGLLEDLDVNLALASARESWVGLDAGLQQVESAASGSLYTDTPAGSELSAAGKSTKAAVDRMLATQTQNMQTMSNALDRLAIILRGDVDDAGRSLRGLLLGGSTIAVFLLGLMLYYAWRWRQSALAAAVAERQVTNILATVREGLFLVGRDLTLGAICSDSLRELLRLPAPAGCHMRDVLEPLVDDKTLTAALKFLGLLWKDKVHEDLIESINPLSQIQASFTNARGGTDVRYLAFSFRRVRVVGASDDSLLGVVADITDRVLLARELEQVRADSGSQAALLLQVLRADPDQLQLFASSADVALRKSNAMLTAPGIEQQDLKNKLNGVFRELHAVKGEASALTLTSFAQRIHAVESMLQSLRGRGTLSGNDFVPIVVKLDELINHLAQLQSMHERVLALQGSRRLPGAQAHTDRDIEEDSHRITTVLSAAPVLGSQAASSLPHSHCDDEDTAAGSASGPSPRPYSALSESLALLTQHTAAALQRSARLQTSGLEQVPQCYASAVKHICIQMIRNAVAHGIELPEERLRVGKSEEGTVRIIFTDEGYEGDGGYRLTIEDDGHGLKYQHIVDRALRLGLIDPQQAAALARSAVYRLIFQPGFSTTEDISEHAGRGVGLDAVSTLVREHGGKIGVSTVAGRYTRFRVTLPGASSLSASSAA